ARPLGLKFEVRTPGVPLPERLSVAALAPLTDSRETASAAPPRIRPPNMQIPSKLGCPVRQLDIDQAAAFRFLRQPSRPNAPRPVAKSGKAVGSGTALSCPRISPPGKFEVWMLK